VKASLVKGARVENPVLADGMIVAQVVQGYLYSGFHKGGRKFE